MASQMQVVTFAAGLVSSHQETAQMQRNRCRSATRLLALALHKTGLRVMRHCQIFLRQDLQKALAGRRRKAQAEVTFYTDISKLRRSDRWKEPDFLDKLKNTYLTEDEIRKADLHTWQDIEAWHRCLQQKDPAIYQGLPFCNSVSRRSLREMKISLAGVRDIEVDVRMPDWSYRFRGDHKVFVHPTEYAKPVVVTTWANFVECVKNAAGPNVVEQDGQHHFYDLSYERAIGEADLSCITREKLDAYGKETEEYYDDFCVWVEAAALAEYGSGVVSVCDEVPESALDSAALQSLIGEHARSQQYVYRAP